MQKASSAIEFGSSFNWLLWAAIERTRIHIRLFLYRKGRNIHIFVCTYDEEMQSALSKQDELEIT